MMKRLEQYTTVHCIMDVSYNDKQFANVNNLYLIPYLITKGCDRGSKVANIYKQLKDLRGMDEKKLTVGQDITEDQYNDIKDMFKLPIIESYLKADQCAAMLEKMIEFGAPS